MLAPKESTDQYTRVVVSSRPRVVGLSKKGGRTATRVRSPAWKLSPSRTQRTRSNGIQKSSLSMA
jgi:hypothetical protein